MYPPRPLVIEKFGDEDALHKLGELRQVEYLRCYLTDLGASSIIEEPYYFDRDYLAEFAAFYSTSARGYRNACRRLHFFSGPELDRHKLEQALRGTDEAREALQKHYLGYSIIRPIPAAPLGRTVLSWYPESNPETPRVIAPSRTYEVHLAGLRLVVDGLAWQQQDTGVSACATVALWSMLHASAFDEHHAVPTTVAITQSAHRNASFGHRVFPSSGLLIEQVCEAVKEQDLSPILLDADMVEIATPYGPFDGFSRRRFGSTCATFLRSGYTVLLAGTLVGVDRHLVCAVGYRPKSTASSVQTGDVAFEDEDISHIYIHDDNVGPGMRCRVREHAEGGFMVLVPEAPPSASHSDGINDPVEQYCPFIPDSFIVAVQNELRLSYDDLHLRGLEVAQLVSEGLKRASGATTKGITLGTRIIKASDYLGEQLQNLFRNRPEVLARTRLELYEKVGPMSLHLGVVRLGLANVPLLDVLYDTTDSSSNVTAFAHIAFQKDADSIITELESCLSHDLGTRISAY